MYKGKKRRYSRHWWRRIQSRKYRRVLIIEAFLLLLVTAAMLFLAFPGGVPKSICLLAWCLIAGIILLPLIMSLRRPESMPSREHQTLAGMPKIQDVDTSSPQPAEASNSRIKEIATKTIDAHSEHTKSKETS